MSETLAIRPTFELISDLPPKEVNRRIHNALAQKNASIKGVVVENHITLKMPSEQQHYWSPQLDLMLEREATGSIIRGRFGPRPSVWLMMVFLYSILGFIGIVIMIMGLAQLNLGMTAHILWFEVLIIGIIVLIFITAKTGQKLGYNEMTQLKQFLLNALQTNQY